MVKGFPYFVQLSSNSDHFLVNSRTSPTFDNDGFLGGSSPSTVLVSSVFDAVKSSKTETGGANHSFTEFEVEPSVVEFYVYRNI